MFLQYCPDAFSSSIVPGRRIKFKKNLHYFREGDDRKHLGITGLEDGDYS